MSYLTPPMKKKRAGPLPRLPTADALRTLGHYGLSEAAFEPIPDDHALIHRHHEVERFRHDRGAPLRPRFNKSTKDELHPFPERALTNTNSCYNGVDVAVTHFPEQVRSSAFLRVPTIKTRSLWSGNQAKSRHSHRYNFQCPALDEKEPKLSYLAETIVEDNSNDKKLLERGWIGNTDTPSIFAAPAPEPDYLKMNKGINHRYLKSRYTGPLEHAKQANEKIRETKRLQRVANQENLMTMHYRPDAPKVFKMSNIDEWWGIDPVTVATEQTDAKKELKSNPFRKQEFGI